MRRRMQTMPEYLSENKRAVANQTAPAFAAGVSALSRYPILPHNQGVTLVGLKLKRGLV